MSNLLTQATVTTITYPFGYQRLLSQLNYEPLDYFVARSWFGFGPETRYLPNTFSYLYNGIYKTDGFFGLYRGLVPKLIGNAVGTSVVNFTQGQLMAIMGSSEKKEEDDDEDEDELIRWLKDYITSATTKAIAQCTGIIVSQPFHVIMIRSVAQFVGRETAYSTLWGSITEIYNNEGILGFFSGLAPRLVGELISIYVAHFITKLVNKYLMTEKEFQPYTSVVAGLVVSTYTYRFQLVSTIMAVNGSGLKVAGLPYMEPYGSWTECYQTLRSLKILNRGSTMFSRVYMNQPISGQQMMTGFSRLPKSQWS